ncbi:MAG TPA: cyclic pyranopterin monophosphate synthase MoaC [Candidatus Ventricola intestinavium]|nr:cyclic pyranopterin monophosphate synthase MoaC [Candidatus Ventricola intestinavium]
MIEKLTHFDPEGRAVMVDVTAKTDTARTAVAKGRIRVSPPVLRAILEGTAKKGDVLGVARVAGIMAVKRTSELIPLCHPLMLGSCSLDFHVDEKACEVEAVCTASLTGQTGVEMEALTGVSVALLTIYDMCKALDKRMEITGIHLAKKTGGKSGVFVNDAECSAPEGNEARMDGPDGRRKGDD